ncbi:MAG: 4-hydroxy-tetrahydrodipicolinate reductase [Anaerovoracaceae bacterium]|jgi:4-hydroxy-tetrahydrodipicolinate reductase
MIRVMVTAPKGKMGRLIIKNIMDCDDLKLTGVLGPKGRDYIGLDAGVVAGLGRDTGVLVDDKVETMIEDCDVIIDFSTVETSMKMVETAVAHRKAFVCGGTGFTEEQEKVFLGAAESIPILRANNTSYMINLMKKLIRMSGIALGGKCKIDVIDMHDEYKLDSPSGTAKDFGKAVKPMEVEYHSIRSGDIPSSHIVIFGGKGERLEISHHAYNWECFAAGACDGARFLHGCPVGYYTMDDVVEGSIK